MFNIKSLTHCEGTLWAKGYKGTNVEQDRLMRDEYLRRWGIKDRGELYTTGTCLWHVTDNHLRATRELPWGLPEVTVIISLTLPPPFLRSAPNLLRTLSDKCHNYSEWSSRSWWTWHGPRWNLLNYVTKNGNRRSHDEYSVREYVGTWTYRHINVLSHYYRRSYVFKGPQSLPR